MTGFASTSRDARNAFISGYPFELVNGGLGVLLVDLSTTSGTTSRTALVGEGKQVMVTNMGFYHAHIAFGTSSIVATTSYVPIAPGVYVLTIPDDATHVAGITSDATTTVHIARGYGN